MTFNTSIGIKQVIRYEWMSYTINLLKSGLTKEEIRKELTYYLSERKGNGTIADRADYTMSLAVTLLMNIWISPKPKLIGFRDRLLKIIDIGNNEPVCHWAMISSVYPFWFNMSYIFGSLFRLQEQVKKSQVMSRTYEVLGERNTVERCSRYVIRSFVSWNIITDYEKPGFYQKGKIINISDVHLASLLIETILNIVPDKRIALSSVSSNPAFFNFKLPSINGSQIIKTNQNLCIEQFSVNDEFISLKT